MGVTTNVKPGKNPCKASYSGKPLSSGDLEFVAVKDHDVTSLLKNGSISVAAQISDLVDECASQGFLLDAVAEVNCSSTSEVASPSLIQKHVGLKRRRL